MPAQWLAMTEPGTRNSELGTRNPELKIPTHQANWYAFYTAPRAEKKVNQRLIEAGFDTFLPLIRTLQQCSEEEKCLIVLYSV